MDSSTPSQATQIEHGPLHESADDTVDATYTGRHERNGSTSFSSFVFPTTHHHHNSSNKQNDATTTILPWNWLPRWKQPATLGCALCLTLFSFWLLDSLKDPLLGSLCRDGDLSRHQPTAKLVSVATTCALVALLESLMSSQPSSSNNSPPPPPDHTSLQTYLPFASNNNNSNHNRHGNDADVLDGGGTWTRMSTEPTTTASLTTPSTVPSTIFASIGVPYCIGFGVLAYLLQFDNNNDTASTTNDDDGRRRSYWTFLGYSAYAAIESYGSLSVAAFWSYCNSHLHLHQAELWYGPMIALAQVGAIAGSTLATLPQYPHSTLMIVACLVILGNVVMMQLYHAWFERAPSATDSFYYARRPEPESSSSKRPWHDDQLSVSSSHRSNAAPREISSSSLYPTPSMVSLPTRQPQQPYRQRQHHRQDSSSAAWPKLPSGIYVLLQHNYALLILGASCFYEVSLTCLNYQMTLLGWDRHGNPQVDDNGGMDQENPNNNDGSGILAFTQFMGRYGQLVNILSLVLSSLVFPRLMQWLGLRTTLCLFPTLLLLVNVMAFVALPGNLMVLFVALSLLKAMTYSIHDPCTEILYLPTAPAIKFQSKFWIDVVGARIAKALGSSINHFSGSVRQSIRVASAPSLCTALALWWVCFRVGNRFNDLIASNQIVGQTTRVVPQPDDDHERASLLDNDDDDDDDDLGDTEIVFEKKKKHHGPTS